VLGREEEVEHAGQEEDFEVVGLAKTSNGGQGSRKRRSMSRGMMRRRGTRRVWGGTMRRRGTRRVWGGTMRGWG
jgi:hypothetical protein